MGRQMDNVPLPHKNGDDSCPVAEFSAAKQVQQLLVDGALAPLRSSHNPGLPEWFDLALFKKGQAYFYKNYFALFTSKLCGLLSILAIPSISRVLVMTKQSALPVTAFKRYVATISQMLLWYEGDLLDPTSSAHKSLMQVRGRHNAASGRARKGGDESITQLDMVLTQFGFMGFAMTSPNKLGLTGTEEEVTGFVHFWRTVGHLMGIEDRFNLCRGTVSETTLLCQSLVEQAFVPAFANPSKDFDSMSHALIEGMWAMMPFLDYTAFWTFTKRLTGIRTKDHDNNNAEQKEYFLAEYYSAYLYHLMCFVFMVLFNNPFVGRIVRGYFNFQMWVTVYLTQNCPFLAYAIYGRMEVNSPMTYH